MLISPRIGTKRLAGLCRRLATALGAGVDMRRVWARETAQASGRGVRARFAAVSGAVERGDSLGEGLAAAEEFFPPLFRELVEVGEQTGRLSDVLAQLADHYERQIAMRRVFLGAIVWPALELAAAVVVIGAVILILGVIRELTGTEVDMLGFGLVGLSGLVKYLVFLAIVGAAVLAIVMAVRRGMVWTRPIQRGVMRVPLLGRALQTVALARLAWVLQLTLNTQMDVRRALGLSLRSTGNARYTDQIATIDTRIAAGGSLYEAFRAADCLPDEFLDALAIGEESGSLVESMGKLSEVYRDQARAAMAALHTVAALAVYAGVGLVIILLIAQLAGFVIGTYRDALRPFQ